MSPAYLSGRVAALEILGIVRTTNLIRETVYRVRYDCCGAAGRLTHQQIMKRKKQDSGHCTVCARHAAGESKRRTEAKKRGAADEKPLFVDEVKTAKPKRVPTGEELNRLWDRAMLAVKARTNELKAPTHGRSHHASAGIQPIGLMEGIS